MKKLFLLFTFLVTSCATDVSIIGPQGPKGDKGDPGLSSYEVWLEELEKGDIIDPKTGKPWDKELNGISHYWAFISGKDGRDGIDGTNGINGLNGEDGKSAFDIWVELVENGLIEYDYEEELTEQDMFLYLKGKDGKDGADGLPGLNGNNGKDGLNGIDGIDGANGLSAYEIWLCYRSSDQDEDGDIDMDDFFDSLKGKDGENGENGINGKNGLSAYELWVKSVKNGLKNPHGQGYWPKWKTKITDFYAYMMGKDGERGLQGKPGPKGEKGDTGEKGDPGESCDCEECNGNECDCENCSQIIFSGIIRAYYAWRTDISIGECFDVNGKQINGSGSSDNIEFTAFLEFIKAFADANKTNPYFNLK